MQLIDLHTHTTYSDGTDRPEEVVRLAKEAGLAAVAVTDHDTAEGVAEALRAGDKYGIKVIPGIEINSRHNGLDMEILGYGIDHTDESIRGVAEFAYKSRMGRIAKIVELINDSDLGIRIDLEKELLPKVRMPGKPHVASLMLEKGVKGKGIHDIVVRYLEPGAPFYVRREKRPTGEVIRIIRSSGGVPVLAHPGFIKAGGSPLLNPSGRMRMDGLDSLVAELKKYGLMGIESRYPYNKSRDSGLLDETQVFEQLEEFAAKNNLLVTGGSDYHGDRKPVKLGEVEVPYSWLEAINEAL